jgi:tetratricopeptide (TPR) repeat protein
MPTPAPPHIPPRQPPGAGTPPRSRFDRLKHTAQLAHLSGKRVLALLTLGITLVGVYRFYTPLITGPPPKDPMTGDLNVAVAGLAAAPGTSGEDASALSESLYRAVRDQVGKLSSGGAPVDVQVAGPGDVGKIGGDAVDERLDTARRLSRELHADVLMYGTLRRRDDVLAVEPEFLFAPRSVAHPEDRQPLLTAVTLPPAPVGRQPLGAIRERGANAAELVARARLRARVAGRARAFAVFIVGLSHYTDAIGRLGAGRPADRQLATAERMLREARSSGDWDPRVAHVLHLFLGNVALMRHAYAAAGREYAAALRAEPGYDRAAFGAAEARFHRAAGGDCSAAAADTGGLAAAMRGYRAVAERAGTAPSLLRAKAQFGLGRAALCAGVAGVRGTWGTAEAAFEAVLRDGDRAGAPAQVAGAHAGVGLVVLLRGDTSRARLSAAAEHFEQAIAATPAGPQQGALWSFLAGARAALGEREAALAAYRKAMRLDPAHRAAYREEADHVREP